MVYNRQQTICLNAKIVEGTNLYLQMEGYALNV